MNKVTIAFFFSMALLLAVVVYRVSARQQVVVKSSASGPVHLNQVIEQPPIFPVFRTIVNQKVSTANPIHITTKNIVTFPEINNKEYLVIIVDDRKQAELVELKLAHF